MLPGADRDPARAHARRRHGDGRPAVLGVRADGRLSSSVYGRAWAAARREVFTPEVFDSPLGKRPYDLRHACVSGWLAAKVESARVANWAGHSVAVLHKVYAKFIDGGEAGSSAHRRVVRHEPEQTVILSRLWAIRGPTVRYSGLMEAEKRQVRAYFDLEMGWRCKSVAQATKVRTLHPPPPATTAR